MGRWWQHSIAELAWRSVSDRGCGRKASRKVQRGASLRVSYGVLVGMLDRGTVLLRVSDLSWRLLCGVSWRVDGGD